MEKLQVHTQSDTILIIIIILLEQQLLDVRKFTRLTLIQVPVDERDSPERHFVQSSLSHKTTGDRDDSR